MNILVPDAWLRDYLKTSATQKQIAEYLSFCGPSVEKLVDSVYSIEVTTNRIDSASILGIAREAAAILPQFGLKASLHSNKLVSLRLVPRVDYLSVRLDNLLCYRFTTVLIKKVQIGESPNWIKQRLLCVGVRPINNVVDISNYIMHEIGQPVHTFDYDKIKGSKMVLRASRKGEKLTTLDGKTHALEGGDIVIEDGSGRLIDLAGIMGGENSAVDRNTKNVLLFVQTYNPLNIRRTSMSLAQRTEAAELFEKGMDPELVTVGISRGIELFCELTKGRPANKILDIYPEPYSPKSVSVDPEFIEKRLGIALSKQKITTILAPLGFRVTWSTNKLEVKVPSWRANDIDIAEDIVEEIARIYGYHRLPSTLMQGALPEPPPNTPFLFEKRVKDILAGWGATEIYTPSLVSAGDVGNTPSLRLKNPLGPDSEYLRTSLMPSLMASANQNKGFADSFHLFEMANVYLPKKGQLPEEKLVLAGIFYNTNFREAKGIIEALLEKLNVQAEFIQSEKKYYAPSKFLEIKSKGQIIGELGILENESLTYWEFDARRLQGSAADTKAFSPLPKYPPQIEDITLTLPERTKAGEVLEAIGASSKLVSQAQLVDIFKNSYTFRVHYQHPTKTLTDSEVQSIRQGILALTKKKFGATA
jgi:phenylalanyl-tRNA synthetase beta chain